MPAFESLIRDMRCHNFTFLIGGGASISSHVESPYELAYTWFKELYAYMLRIPELETDENRWVKSVIARENIWDSLDTKQVATALMHRNDDDWFRMASFIIDGLSCSYYKIATMLEDTIPDGREIINSTVEHIADKAMPHYGYKLLAYLLSTLQDSNVRHDAVITTNFDNLLTEVFFYLREEYPEMRVDSTRPKSITMGDDDRQLDRFNQWVINPQNPLIFHVHNSQDFNPRNTAREVGYYPQRTDEALHRLVDDRYLLVMGYSGSDEGLMTVIKDSCCQRVYWLSYSGAEPKSKPYQRLKQKLGGNLIILSCPKPESVGCPKDCPKGFDSFMWKLVKRLYPECPIISQMSHVNESVPTEGFNNTTKFMNDQINIAQRNIYNLYTYDNIGNIT